MSNDVGKAKSFFGKLFDWKLEDMPMGDGNYTIIKVGEGQGRHHENPIPGAPSAWMAYVLVDDLKGQRTRPGRLGRP
jgi:predicted enzyme related to lactoylglutathione lyase